MKPKNILILFICCTLFFSCAGTESQIVDPAVQQDSIVNKIVNADTSAHISQGNPIHQTGNPKMDSLVNFAESLIGVPYKYASTNPAEGFDCSGFITYVFNHFNISVPRSSVDFTNVGQTVELHLAKPGDLILFTGTDSTIRVVGHMGIVIQNDDTLRFIHSTSGKQYGVTITPLNSYYMGRFVKIIRYL